MFYIYLLENKINHKKYIGQTCQSPQNRWANGAGYKGQGVIGAAIEKYGWDNFDHIILEEVETQKEADARESYYIQYYDCLACNRKGYNVSSGGQAGYPLAGFTEQEKQSYKEKQSIAGKKRFQENPELYQKMSEISKNYWTEENRLLKSAQMKEYYSQNLEAKEKFAQYGKEYIEKIKIPVKCIETGEVFESLTAAGEWCDVSGTSISLYLKGKGQYAGHHPDTNIRLHWCYPKQNEQELKNKIYNIICLETGERFETAAEAGKAYHVDSSALCKHLNHPETYKSCGKHPITHERLHWKRI